MSKVGTFFLAILFIEVMLLASILLQDHNFQLLSPQGLIARQQRDFIVVFVSIMLVVAVPILGLFYYFAYKYRSSNRKAAYRPDTKYSKLVVFLWWLIPSIVVIFLGVMTWNKTHALDPYRPIESSIEPIKIQVVALQWKWLFLYPEYNIATVSHIRMPVATPVNFELTADAPMNSFWIPSLSGQIYAMTGMSTKLHVMADAIGEYRGYAAEINGKGFSKMNFTVQATSNEDFAVWIEEVKSSQKRLDMSEYDILSSPTEGSPVIYYGSYEKDLYNKIINKFMPSMEHGEHSMEH